MTSDSSSTRMWNRAAEDAAIEFVIAHEAERGRTASDSRGRTASDSRGRGAAGEVDSDGDPVIEVKAYGGSARWSDLWLATLQVAVTT